MPDSGPTGGASRSSAAHGTEPAGAGDCSGGPRAESAVVVCATTDVVPESIGAGRICLQHTGGDTTDWQSQYRSVGAELQRSGAAARSVADDVRDAGWNPAPGDQRSTAGRDGGD